MDTLSILSRESFDHKQINDVIGFLLLHNAIRNLILITSNIGSDINNEIVYCLFMIKEHMGQKVKTVHWTGLSMITHSNLQNFLIIGPRNRENNRGTKEKEKKKAI